MKWRAKVCVNTRTGKVERSYLNGFVEGKPHCKWIKVEYEDGEAT